MERNAKFFIGIAIFLIAVLVIGGYIYLQSREFIRGPQLSITSPQDGTSFREAAIIIRGRAQNVAYLSLNDSAIFVDSEGNFTEKLLLLPGYNILSVKAVDRFGKKTEKTLELVYKEATKAVMASSTQSKN